jgi:glycosyltransferase involved in cell wall biosynthesis
LYYPELNVGGVERHILSLIRQTNNEFKWFLIAPVSQGYRKLLRESQVKILRWRPKSVWSLATLPELIGLLKNNRIALVHIHGPEVFILGKLAALACGIPVVITFHLRIAEYFRGTSVKARIKKAAFLIFDSILNLLVHPYVIYVSKNDIAKERRVGYSHERIFVVSNGVDSRIFSSARRSRTKIRRSIGITPSTIVVSFLGRLDQQKGIDTLINAFVDFNRRYSKTCLWLIGDGPLRKHYESLTDKILRGKVVIWGFRPDVPELLAATDIFVSPSNYESTSFAILEAMASQLPVIATDVGEANMIISNQINGILIHRGNTAEMTGALLEVAANKELRKKLGSAARKSIREYSLDQMVSDVMRVYKNALSNN